MYTFETDYLTHNRPRRIFRPKGMVVHDTADNGATADNERHYFNTTTRQASAHAVIDWNKILCCIPWTEEAWHACHTANRKFIGIELCKPATHDPVKFKAVWDRAVWAYAFIFLNVLKLKIVTKDNLMSHAEVTAKWHESDHQDPVSYFAEYGKTVNDFRAEVQDKINETVGGGSFSLMDNYNLKPVAKGMLLGTTTLTCCSKPSNSAKTASVLRKGKNEPIKIYAKTTNEGLDWYLVNSVNEQWVASKYVKLML
jgi:hypothetical protein